MTRQRPTTPPLDADVCAVIADFLVMKALAYQMDMAFVQTEEAWTTLPGGAETTAQEGGA